jgi:hypothetical protein
MENNFKHASHFKTVICLSFKCRLKLLFYEVKCSVEHFIYFLLIPENELNATEQVSEGVVTLGQEEAIKPLERRAINFLINEFLLQQNYKLTAVTFSEENEDQVSSELEITTSKPFLSYSLCNFY